MRTVIVGGPRTGKTTKAETLGAPIVHTDDSIPVGGFSAQSTAVTHFFHDPGPWTIEGVSAVRALRKWLTTHPGAPCDQVIHLKNAVAAQSAGQAALHKGCETIWSDVQSELRRRGVRIVEG